MSKETTQEFNWQKRVLVNANRLKIILDSLPEEQKDTVIVKDMYNSLKHCEDQIQLVWQVDDILGMIEDDDEKKLTKHEARQVLNRADNCHDANIGINWEVLDYYIDEFIKDRDEK